LIELEKLWNSVELILTGQNVPALSVLGAILFVLFVPVINKYISEFGYALRPLKTPSWKIRQQESALAESILDNDDLRARLETTLEMLNVVIEQRNDSDWTCVILELRTRDLERLVMRLSEKSHAE
jgi:hypothetical protein